MAKAQYIWHTPSGLDTLAINKQCVLVQVDTLYNVSDLTALITHKNQIDSIDYNHFLTDSAQNYFVLSIDSTISDSSFKTVLHFLDTSAKIEKVSEVFGDQLPIISTPIIMVRLYNIADTTLLKSIATSHNCSFIAKFYNDSMTYLLKENNADSNAIQLSRKIHETGYFVFAEPNFAFQNISTTNDPELNNQWYLNNTGSNHSNISSCSSGGEDIDAFSAWNTSTGCQYQTIAILDDGVWPFHDDLDCGNYGYNALLEDPFYKRNYDFYNLNAIPDDSSRKHGTRCAGIAAGTGDNSIGIAGVAYNSKIIGIKIFSITNKTSCIAIAAAYKIAKHQQVDVISGSFAIYNSSWTPNDFKFNSYLISNAIKDLAQNGRNGLGTPMVHSTGNGEARHLCQSGIPEVGFPANDTNTIAVTSSDYCDNLVAEPNFSYCADYGGNTFVAAPGVEILTTNVDYYGGPHYNYTNFEGTSSATPIVAGVIGLMLSANPMLNYRQCKNILANAADQVTYTYTNDADHPWRNWSEEFGYGRVNAYNAALLAQNTKFSLYSYNYGTTTEILTSTLNVNAVDFPSLQLKVLCPLSVEEHLIISWYRNGILLSEDGVILDIQLPGKYKVVIQNPCNASTLESKEVEVNVNCPISNDYYNTAIWTAPTPALVYNMEGTINIAGNITFSNCHIIMKPGSVIIVDPGFTFTLNNVQITSCGSWVGIRVQYDPIAGRGILDVDQGSSISKAIRAVSVENGGILLADDCVFDDNEMHVSIDAYSSTHLSSIANSQFGILSAYGGNAHPHSISNNSNCQVFMEQINDLEITNSQFFSLNPNSISNTSDLELNDVQNLNIEDNTFGTSHETAIQMTICSDIDIIDNLFNYQNLPITSVPGSSYQYNGIFSDQCEDIEISENNFLGCSEGIEFYQNISGAANSDIQSNRFKYCNYGIIFSPIENPLTASSGANDNCSTYLHNINVQFYCNIFEDNSAGVIGSGEFPDQGSGGPGGGVNNDFTGNVDWDLLWESCSNPEFNYNENLATSLNTTSGQPSYTLNGNSVNTEKFGKFNYSNRNDCITPSPFIHEESESINHSVFVKAYSNPFNETLILENSSANPIYFFILSSIGIQVSNGKIESNTKLHLDLHELADGVYHLHFNNSQKTIKLLKIGSN